MKKMPDLIVIEEIQNKRREVAYRKGKKFYIECDSKYNKGQKLYCQRDKRFSTYFSNRALWSESEALDILKELKYEYDNPRIIEENKSNYERRK